MRLVLIPSISFSVRRPATHFDNVKLDGHRILILITVLAITHVMAGIFWEPGHK